MKVNEIVREENLNEALGAAIPIAGGAAVVSLSSIWRAVTIGFAAYGSYQIYELLKENNYDPDEMSDEEWLELFMQLATIFVPSIGKAGTAAVVARLPDWFKTKAIQFVKWTTTKKLTPEAKAKLKKELAANKKSRDAILKKGPPTKRDAKELNRLAKKDAAARTAAQATMTGLTPVARQVIELTGVGVVAYDYWTTLKYLEAQYNLEISKPGQSELYAEANGDKEVAASMFREDADALLGETIFKVTALIKPGIAEKMFKGLGNAVGVISPLLGWPIKFTGQIIGWLKTGAVSTTGRVAALVWLETAAGKEFLANSIVASILGFSGSAFRIVAETIAKLVDTFTGTEVASNAVSAATAGDIKPTTSGQSDEFHGDKDPYGLTLYQDKKNPKIKYVGGQQITTPDGYIKNNIPATLGDIADKAKALNLPNPLDQLQYNPNLIYSGSKY